MSYDPLYKIHGKFNQICHMQWRPPGTKENYMQKFMREQQVTSDLISRLGLVDTLEGHNGCVNCLQWSSDGELLASGSDDNSAIVWHGHTGKKRCTIATGHVGNIFSVNFMPHTCNATLLTAAADGLIIVSDVCRAQPQKRIECHKNRVKRLATAPDSASLFWSASEDGTVRQFDLRDADLNLDRNVLIDLHYLCGSDATAKCISVNPTRTNLLAVGAQDYCARIFDRRMLTLTQSIEDGGSSSSDRGLAAAHTLSDADQASGIAGDQYNLDCAQYFIPGHLPKKKSNRDHGYAITYLTFSADGNELLVNMGSDHVYLMHMAHLNEVCTYSKLSSSSSSSSNSSKSQQLTEDANRLKQAANDALISDECHKSLTLYNQALALCPHSPVLLCNRAAAFLKRNWSGDAYAALRDCYEALQLDENYYKAHYRFAKCLHTLGWHKEALDCLNDFKLKYPTYASDCLKLFDQVQKDANKSSQPSNSSAGRLQPQQLTLMEQQLRSSAADYQLRFTGHCNITTDIKEANFFGDSHIVAGSDDGNFFIWNRHTTDIVRVLHGDDSIVNCLQPHPSVCLLSSSGIDSVVRMWAPMAQNDCENDRLITDVPDAIKRNQRMMRTNPVELMFSNLGYRFEFNDSAAGSDDDDDSAHGPNIPRCPTS